MGIFFAKNSDEYVGARHFLFARRLDVQNGTLNDALEPQGWLGFRLGILCNNRCVIFGKTRQFVTQCF